MSDANIAEPKGGKAPAKTYKPFTLEDAEIEAASLSLKTLLDLIVLVNAKVSEANADPSLIDEAVFKQMIALVGEDIEAGNVWDYSAAFVLKAHHLPLDKAQLVMYSLLTPPDFKRILKQLERALLRAQNAAVETQKNQDEAPQRSQDEELEAQSSKPEESENPQSIPGAEVDPL